jgi:cytochrome c
MKKMALVILAGFFFLGLIGLQSVYANQNDAKALAEKAATFVKANCKEKGLAELSKPKGQFDKGELYVFAYDMKATVIAHPKNSKLIGKNLLEVPDNDGRYFRKEAVEIAKTKGTGWVDYKYLNPETKKVEHKTTYVMKVDDMILACGAYK